MNTAAYLDLPLDIWTIIIENKFTQKDLFALAKTTIGFLTIVNRCWLSIAKTYGVNIKKIVFTAKCLTMTQTIYANQQAFSKMPWFLDAFKAWIRGPDDVVVSMQPYYPSQTPYDCTHNDKPMYSINPGSCDELFRLFAATQNIRNGIAVPVEAWTIIIRKLPQIDLLTLSKVSKDFLVIVNRCWVSLAETYGIKRYCIYLIPGCMTILKSIYDAQERDSRLILKNASKPKTLDALFRQYALSKEDL